MRRLFGWLCTILLILTPMLSANGEEIPAADPEESTAVYYVHASKDPEQVRTAIYVIEAIAEKYPERELFRVEGVKSYQTIQDLANIRENLMDLSRLENGDVLLAASPRNPAADVWMVIPDGKEEACRKAVQSQALMDRISSILGNPQSRIHLVMIGDDVQEPDENTAFAKLAAAFPERVEWIRIRSDFTVQKCDGDGLVHTGDFFLASLFGMPDNSFLLGKPVDLISDLSAEPSARPADPNLQQNVQKWSISLPENGNVLILQRSTGNAAEDPILENADGGSVRFDSGFNLRPASGKEDPNYSGVFAVSLMSGRYYLSGCSEDTKVYWYPDLGKLNPVFEMGKDDKWIWGEQKISLTLDDTLGRAEQFIVNYERSNNNTGSFSKHTFPYASENRWEASFSVPQDSNIDKVKIIPSIKLFMKDGNLIWEWRGDLQTRELSSTPVTVRENAPTEPVILYFTEEKSRVYSGKWEDFFDFNSSENYDCGIERGENVPEDSIDLRSGNGEFSVEVKPGNKESGSGSIKLNYGDAAHELELVWKNATDFRNAIEISAAPETVHAGGETALTAKISREIYNEWAEARNQLGEEVFPGPEGLRLKGFLQTGPDENDSPAEMLPEEIPFTEDTEGSYTAVINIQIPENSEDKKYEIRYEISNAGGTSADRMHAEVKKDSVPVTVLNTPPKRNESFPEKSDKTEISLEGMPGSYASKDLLNESLNKVFGTDNLFDLFADDETDVKTITVSISNTDGLTIDGSAPEENETERTIEPGQPAEILTTKPTKRTWPWEKEAPYIITLKASDGVNESEAVTISVSVYSSILRTAMFIAAGIVLLLLILAAILIVRQIRKPTFEDIKLRCYVSSDDNAERGREILTKCQPSSMAHFGKKAVSLSDLLILTRQPSISPETTEITDDIMLLPTKHGEVNVLYGKKAMGRIGRHEKRELIPQNNVCRMRIDNQYIQIENVR